MPLRKVKLIHMHAPLLKIEKAVECANDNPLLLALTTMLADLGVERLHGKSNHDLIDDVLTQKIGEMIQAGDDRLAVLAKMPVPRPFFVCETYQLITQFRSAVDGAANSSARG